MIEVRVNTIWQGKVGIRDRYIKEAQETEQGLTIVHREERMAIPFHQLKELIVGKSERPFTDRYGKDPHYLIYFNWKPEAKQGVMI